MSKKATYHHWHLDTDKDHILWLSFNRADCSVNTISMAVLEELEHILDDISHKPPKAVVIVSGKEHGFIAGADLTPMATADVNTVIEIVRKGQRVFEKLEQVSVPTVAMINGFCLGGGLELSLACRYRVAEDGTQGTTLGLPEVRLGIQPAWGGSVRMPALIGPLAAMDLMLSGRQVSGKAAARMGLVDAAVPLRELKRAATFYALNAPAPHKPKWWQNAINYPPLRQLAGAFLRRKLTEKIDPNYYPAPFLVLDTWAQEWPRGEKGFAIEVSSIGKLLSSDTAKNLMRVFFLREQLKGLTKGESFSPRTVHVVGAGVMGGDIAAWCALRGMQVTLQDQKPEYIASAIKRAYALFSKKLKTPRAIQEAMDRLIPDQEGLGIAKADVIIEAIFEDLKAKQNLFKEVEAKARPDAILATNTSSIPLDEINTVLQNPARLVGIHFFNPVAMMPLVEVVKGEKTAATVLHKALAFVGKIDRLPLPVKSSPGFLVNRILMPYLMECIQLIDEGVPLAAIDKAAVNFGMPMGPVELVDTVGLDVCLGAARTLTSHFGGTVPERLVKMVEAGQLGRKTNQGFYRYVKGKPQKDALPKDYSIPKDISQRLVMRMVNEAVACLQEGVVENADRVDAGMIFGSGFPPFRGGVMQYAETMGQPQLLEIMSRLEQQYGVRFKATAAEVIFS